MNVGLPSWVQIFASGSCFQIPLACVPLPVKILKALLLIQAYLYCKMCTVSVLP